MKKWILCSILACLTLLAPHLVAASGSHAHDHVPASSNETHSQTDGPGEGGFMTIGSMSSKGVRGTASIKAITDPEARLATQASHHFMITFVNESTGESVALGTVALQLTNPDAKVADPLALMAMDGHFGADIVLDMNGEYHFRLGTKLADGLKRKYHFHSVNKLPSHH